MPNRELAYIFGAGIGVGAVVGGGGALAVAGVAAAPGAYASAQTFFYANAARITVASGIAGEFITSVPLTVPVATGSGVAFFGVVERGANAVSPVRARVLANIAESQAARASSNFGQLARFERAFDFYKAGGWSSDRALSHVRGIDLSLPVDIVELSRGTRLGQYQVPGAPLGNYFAPLGTSASELGINPAGKVLNVYTASGNVTALRSTAASILDTWSVPSVPYRASGGGIQYFTHTPHVFK